MSVGWGWDDKQNLEKLVTTSRDQSEKLVYVLAKIADALEEQNRISRDVLDIQQELLAIHRGNAELNRMAVASMRERTIADLERQQERNDD